jgi:hypothetical protein
MMRATHVKYPHIAVLTAIAAGVLAGCGGGTGSSPSDAFPYAQQPTTGPASASFSGAPQNVTLPATAGYSGTAVLPPATTGAGTAVTLSAGISPPGADPVLAPTRTGSGPAPIPLIYLGIVPAATVSLPSLPSFTITLPPDIATGPNFYLGLYDPAKQLAGYALATEGPAMVSGSTLTFNAPAAPITLQANQTYALSLYAIPTPPPGT